MASHQCFKFQHVKEIVFNAYEWEFLGAMKWIAHCHPQVKSIMCLDRAKQGTQPAYLNDLTFSRFRHTKYS